MFNFSDEAREDGTLFLDPITGEPTHNTGDE
jgi:hypothetical protein